MKTFVDVATILLADLLSLLNKPYVVISKTSGDERKKR